MFLNNFWWNTVPYGSLNAENHDHTYCLCVEGLGKVKTSYHSSRIAANTEMYHIMGEHGLHLKDTYDDHHDKTYICDNGVRFYITRW